MKELDKVKFELKDKILMIVSDNSSELDEKLENFIGVKKKDLPIVLLFFLKKFKFEFLKRLILLIQVVVLK